jgi:hypothetical protein
MICRYSSHNAVRATKSRIMRRGGYLARTEKMRNAHTILDGEPEENRTLGRHRHSWPEHIKMGFTTEIGCQDADLIQQTQNKV